MHNSNKIILSIAVLWTGFITFLSLASVGSTFGKAIKIPNKDKYVHFAFYFFFVIFWSLYFKKDKKRIQILLAAIGFGILMEICQGLFTKTRSPDILDVVANTFGAIMGLVIVFSFRYNTEK